MICFERVRNVDLFVAQARSAWYIDSSCIYKPIINTKFMKNLYALLGFVMLCFMSLQTNTAKACVDPDSTVIIDVCYDTTQAPLINEIEIRITNLRMMNEAPNTICSCALTTWSDLFSNIQYVAFVDSGTNNPYDGFAAFNNSAAVDQAWATSPGGNWNGYIADVINSGLTAVDPVEMVIRASTPAGVFYTLVGDSIQGYNSLQDDVVSESLGTDAWDPQTQTLVNDHLSVKSFAPWAHPGNSINFIAQPGSYFTQLDADILNNIAAVPTATLASGSVEAYPNPFHHQLNLKLTFEESAEVTVVLYDVLGKQVWSATRNQFPAGESILTVDTESLNLRAGVYTLRVESDEESVSQQLVYR